MMYMRESRKEVPVAPIPLALGVALAVCMAATLYLGLFPSEVLRYAQDSAQQVIRRSEPEIPVPVPVSAVPASL
jgi:NADH:ubiquinone oxidoreductase subunit 2 (subunit N)